MRPTATSTKVDPGKENIFPVLAVVRVKRAKRKLFRDASFKKRCFIQNQPIVIQISTGKTRTREVACVNKVVGGMVLFDLARLRLYLQRLPTLPIPSHFSGSQPGPSTLRLEGTALREGMSLGR